MAFDGKTALKYRLILLEGDFASERKKALDAIVEAAGLAEGDAFDRESITSNEKPFAEWISSASTTPFMANRRCVIVRNIYRITPEDASESLSLNYLAELPESALLILVGDDEAVTKEGGKDSKKENPKLTWRKVVERSKGLVVKFVMKDTNSGKNLQDIAKEGGKKLSPRSMSLLLEMTANRLDRAEEELEKLIIYVGDAPEIQPDDVKRSVTPEPEHNVFQMLDACWRGDASRALAQLQRLRGMTRSFDDEARRLVPLFAAQLRTLWQARGIVERMGVEWELESKPIGKMNDYARRKSVENVQRLSFPQLLECLKAVRLANGHLTAQSLGVDSVEVIEQMILSLCQIAKNRKIA